MRTQAADPWALDESFALGRFEVHPQRNGVQGPDGYYCLEPKLMAVLTQLAAARGATLTKSDLLERVWPRRYVVEGVLKRAVSELRRVLGDDARAPRYIETVYKKGYRLIERPRRCDPAACPPDPGSERVVIGSIKEISLFLDTMTQALPPTTTMMLVFGPSSPL